SPVGSDCFYQYDVIDDGGPAGDFFSRKSLALSYGGTIYLRTCLKTIVRNLERNMRGGIPAIVWGHVPKRFAGRAAGEAGAIAEGAAEQAPCWGPSAEI
ncbi:MAG: hypothetical protein ABI076_09330, partial [Acidobacteriaceae bacterium]